MWFCAADPLCLEGLAQGELGKQVSLWWRWLAAEGNGETVPQLWAGEETELELEPELGPRLVLELELEAGQGKQEQQCGLQHCFGLHHHLHWLPEEAAGLTWLLVSALLLIGRAEAVAREVLGFRGR